MRTQLRDVAKRQVDRVAARVAAHVEGRPQTPRDYYAAAAELMRRRYDPAPFVDTPALGAFELRVSSQNGEDGIIAEIQRRIGLTDDPYFVEFGIERGTEGNCVVLADLLDWRGLFIDGDPAEFAGLRSKYRWSRVTTLQAMVRPDNVQELFARGGVPEEPDVLSIDIDGGDYWIWQAIREYRPRLVIVEYNGGLDPTRREVVPRDFPGWDRTDWFGASAGALRTLGEAKGYRLVHTDVTGLNAFFVRRDLGGDWPAEPRIHAPNYYLRGWAHPADPAGRGYLSDPPVS